MYFEYNVTIWVCNLYDNYCIIKNNRDVMLIGIFMVFGKLEKQRRRSNNNNNIYQKLFTEIPKTKFLQNIRINSPIDQYKIVTIL